MGKIVRILAWILRALTPTLRRQHLPCYYLTLLELLKAKLAIIKYVQKKDDIEKLTRDGHVGQHSKLLNLNCFIDKDGLLRVGGRLRREHKRRNEAPKGNS